MAKDDPVQIIYESVRGEALQELEPPSWARERVRRYGVAGLFAGSQKDFPFILYTRSVPRPAWSGKRDFHKERLHQVYDFLIKKGRENSSRRLGPDYLDDIADKGYDYAAVGSLEGVCSQKGDENHRGVYD